MFCKNCGAKLESDVKFCGSCGKALNEEAASSHPTTPLKTVDQKPTPFPHGGRIEGWLSLIGLGLLAAGVEFVIAIFSSETGTATVINIFLLAFLVYVAYLFFKRNHRFPKYFIIYLSALALLAIFAGIGTNWQDSSISGPIVAAVVWIPYALVSKRVKATFVY